jgi:ABC-type bacteriocin/lantibiotic exporter with double-glycine peptidase domain
MELSAGLSGTVTALLGGIQKIKLAGAEDRAFAKWAHGYADYARSAYNRPAPVRAMSAVGSIISMLGTVAIYASAGATGVGIADYMSFNAAYGQLSAGIMALMGMTAQVAQLGPMLEMVKPILEAKPELSEGKPSVTSLTGAMEVSGVSFRYGPDDPYVLKDLSFKIRPGEYVALVGKSGCGKSTILRLLLGFETPERGTITFGPNDASKVDVGSLRRHIGVVTQNGRLFMGDLASNITIAAPSATLDDAWRAAELAGIADDIRKMPMGMQTIVTEGSGGISGGQRQRIMIARAICGNKRILMFDEATSALDNMSQRHVSDSLDSLKCTRLVVAHRLSTVRHCDRILVVDGGRIAEQGTYEELIEQGGLFAELVARQRLEGE